MITRKEFLQLTLKSVFIIGAGNSLQSFSANTFALPAKDKIKLRFALASDGHYGQEATDYELHHNNMIAWLNREREQRGIEFSMINGDLFHNDINFLPVVKKKWDQLKMPYFVSHGNHDQIREELWKDAWNTGWHHSFEKNDAVFLILNTSDEKGEYICPDLAWTSQQLEKYKSKKHVIVFMHITPHKWTNAGIECPELTSMFNKYPNVKAIFHGHDHDQDGMKERDGKYYFFDSHIAGNWGTEYRGYRIVEILNNDEILTYQMDAGKQIKINENTIK